MNLFTYSVICKHSAMTDVPVNIDISNKLPHTSTNNKNKKGKK